MRPSVLIVMMLPLFGGAMSAHAGKSGGGNGGSSGPLHQTSAGIGAATTPSSGSGGSHGQTGEPPPEPVRPRYVETPNEPLGTALAGVVTEAAVDGAVAVAPAVASKLDAYAGMQKVHDSDGSFTFELGVHEGRFRVAGSVTRYIESQPGDDLTLTMPAIAAGYRIDDGGATRVHLELGVVGAKTKHDPVMDSSLTGVLGGLRVEHTLRGHLAIVGDAREMFFDDSIRAHALRLGARYRFLEASVRVVDFNVGPPLYGPEIGVAF